MSVSLFLNKFICIIFLDSIYKWYHMIFVFPRVHDFTKPLLLPVFSQWHCLNVLATVSPRLPEASGFSWRNSGDGNGKFSVFWTIVAQVWSPQLPLLTGRYLLTDWGGYFYVLTWWGDGAQLFNQTLNWVLLWRSLVDVGNIYNQSTLRRLPLIMDGGGLVHIHSWRR